MAGLFAAFPGKIERDCGPKSTLTTDLANEYRGERLPELAAELERRETTLYVSRRPFQRYRKVFQPEQVMAFVREPVARVIAQWEAMRSRQANPFTGSLLEFAEMPVHQNAQSRMLRGVPLRRLGFLGSAELYKDSLRELRLLDGLAAIPPELADDVPNATSYEPTADESIKLRELNQEDVSLFQRARGVTAVARRQTGDRPKITPDQRATIHKERHRRAVRAARLHKGPYAVGPLPLVWKAQNLALLFTPKAGCTFAVKWFLDQIGLLPEALAHGNWIHDYRQGIFYALEGYRPDDIALPGMRILKFARNPFDRAVSSYVHANRMGYEDELVQAFLGRPVTANNRYSFREFVSYLGSIDLQRCNPHHLLQAHKLEVDGLVTPTHLVRLEESRRVIPALERELQLKTTNLDALSSSGHHTERSIDEKFCGDQAFKLGRGNIRLPGNKAFYDADLERAVAELYGEDFTRYGYAPKLRP
jgi:hypothetical protein